MKVNPVDAKIRVVRDEAYVLPCYVMHYENYCPSRSRVNPCVVIEALWWMRLIAGLTVLSVITLLLSECLAFPLSWLSCADNFVYVSVNAARHYSYLYLRLIMYAMAWQFLYNILLFPAWLVVSHLAVYCFYLLRFLASSLFYLLTSFPYGNYVALFLGLAFTLLLFSRSLSMKRSASAAFFCRRRIRTKRC